MVEYIDKIIQTDCLAGLKALPDNCIDCCITSPPYYGLRDYGTAIWQGGNSTCDHKNLKSVQSGKSHSHSVDQPSRVNTIKPYKDICAKCGAIRIDDQIGLEKTPEEFIQKLVIIFREVRRVLKNNGTLWLNIGDSYWGGKGKSGQAYATENLDRNTLQKKQHHISRKGEIRPTDGKHETIKPKDLIGIPWMLAFTLRADGWYLRQDIIWHKPNPMPESVTDRCTKSPEYIFLLTKSKKYYYDAEAIKVDAKNPEDDLRRITAAQSKNKSNPDERKNGLRPRSKSGNKSRKTGADRGCPENSGSNVCSSVPWEGEKANKRSVWSVVTKPYAEAHFATFPQELIVDPIKAGCPVGGLILDPFMGAGTTALVAKKLNRHYLGFELNANYIAIAQKRLRKELGLFQ